MFNINSGYIGSSRSMRSREAIADFEIPITLINRDLIQTFLDEYKESFSKEELELLKRTTVTKWKYVAKKRMRASSWHHTGSYFTETDHYRLLDIAEKIIELKDTLDADYKNHLKVSKKEQQIQKNNYKFGVINVQIWGGSRKHPKIEGYDEVAGILIGDWLYYYKNNFINKYKTTANKVEWLKEYDSYSELTKNHKEYKNTKKVFNKLIKEKVR